MQRTEFDLRTMNTPQYIRSADASCDTSKSRVKETCQAVISRLDTFWFNDSFCHPDFSVYSGLTRIRLVRTILDLNEPWTNGLFVARHYRQMQPKEHRSLQRGCLRNGVGHLTLEVVRFIQEICSLQHRHASKSLWRVFDSMFHVFHHGLLPNRFLDLLLSFNVEWVCVEKGHLLLSLILYLRVPLPSLSQKLAKTPRIVPS